MKKLINKLTGLFRRKRRIGQSRNIKRAEFLYWYIQIGGIAAFVYAFASLFIKSWPIWLAFTPVMILIILFLSIQFLRTWKVIWMGIKDMDKGKLLLYLNNNTHYSEAHKIELVNWVYLSRRSIRLERRAELMEKVRTGISLTKEEKKELRRKTVKCPQQIRDSVNEALLVAALIYAHTNISRLDKEIRGIMDLTDEHNASFDLNTEIDRCRRKKSA